MLLLTSTFFVFIKHSINIGNLLLLTSDVYVVFEAKNKTLFGGIPYYLQSYIYGHKHIYLQYITFFLQTAFSPNLLLYEGMSLFKLQRMGEIFVCICSS